MKLIRLKNIILFLALLLAINVNAQNFKDFEEQYVSSKSLYSKGEFEKAIYGFNGLIPLNNNNPFSPYAIFYKAKCFLSLDKLSEARFVLVSGINYFARWEKIDDYCDVLSHV